MSDLPNLPSGVYRHYKGPLYLVLGYAHDASEGQDNKVMVAYVGLELDEAKTGPRIAVRDAAEFCGYLDLPSGETVKRFRYLGATYEGKTSP